MNKQVLIISPYFAPANAADMHRVRMSLPYFHQYGWEAEVVTVHEKYLDTLKDELLLKSLPDHLIIHYIKALPQKWTRRSGFGSIAFRSMWFYLKKVNSLLKQKNYDLIYFSTTQFPVCVLGAYWKRKFNIPYVIDMQDPWYTGHYHQPENLNSLKNKLVYQIHKQLESMTMKMVDGLISVSEQYIITLKEYYPAMKNIPAATITFGAFKPDLKTATDHQHNYIDLLLPGFTNIVYAGRGGADMHKALIPLFMTLKQGITKQPEIFEKLRFYFIGTSYAPSGSGKQTILPLAKQYSLDKYVIEITDRLSYFHTLLTLQKAHALFIPGSDDRGYTASKIFPYLLVKKPLLAIFNKNSNAAAILKNIAQHVHLLTFSGSEEADQEIIYKILLQWGQGKFEEVTLEPAFENYTAETLTRQQVSLFNAAVQHFKRKI